MFGPLEAAQKELTRISARKASLEQQREAKARELATAEQDSGIELLDSEDDAKTLGHLAGLAARLRAELGVLDSAIALAKSKLAAAARVVRVAEIADLRDQAATKRKRVEELHRASGPLLAKLSEIEGLPFSRAIFGGERVGGWIPLPVRADLPADLRNTNEVQADINGTFGVPLSRRLCDEAYQIEETARDLELKLAREELEPLPERPRSEPGLQVPNTNPKSRLVPPSLR